MAKNKYWKEELDHLQQIVEKSGLEKKTKWGIPVFCYDSKNVVGIVGVKSYFGLWFYNGVFLKDDNNLLVNANKDGKTKSLRQMRFKSLDEVDENIILSYINEAIEVEKKALKLPSENKDIEVPEILKSTFEKDPKLKSAFSEFPRFKQNEFMEYLSSAKKEQTRINRLNKISPMILKGIGLNDKYR